MPQFSGFSISYFTIAASQNLGIVYLASVGLDSGEVVVMKSAGATVIWWLD